MRSTSIVVFASLVATSVCSQETIKSASQAEIGIDQKLARVYDLYRRGDAVSLKPSETQLGIGVSYALSDRETLGFRQNTRSFSTQAFVSRGVSSGLEASLTAPLTVQSQHAETTDTVVASDKVSGFGDPTVRFIGSLPAKEINTSLIFAATLPIGSNALTHKETHTSFGASWNTVLRPAFVSGGLSLKRDWKSDVNGIGYNAGLGFFLNHALSVGGQVSGVAMMNPKVGSVRDSTAIGFKIAYQTTPDLGIVATADFGVGTGTPQTTIGLTTYWRF
jgi:Putative MetA-pathway of phenol degradation